MGLSILFTFLGLDDYKSVLEKTSQRLCAILNDNPVPVSITFCVKL